MTRPPTRQKTRRWSAPINERRQKNSTTYNIESERVGKQGQKQIGEAVFRKGKVNFKITVLFCTDRKRKLKLIIASDYQGTNMYSVVHAQLSRLANIDCYI